MLHRIINQKYGQDSERELIALKHNVTIRVYDASSNRWIVNQEVDPVAKRVVSILWDRNTTHYDLLIPEVDNFVETRSRQLQNIYNRCSFHSQLPNRYPVHKIKRVTLEQSNESQKTEQCHVHDVEQVDYSSSTEEELNEQEHYSDFVWDQDRFIFYQ